MFNKKDPLIGAVTKIMEENARRRQVEIDLCEELGIVSRAQLPREHLANYDALLEQRLDEALKGNQHKIDANQNNKIDAHDFKLLRAKKDMKEQNVIQQKSGNPIPPTTMQRVQGEPGEKAPKFGPQTGSTNQVSSSDREEMNKKVKQLDELSAEKVGAVNKARLDKPSKTKKASQTLARAVTKKWLNSNVGKLIPAEKKMDESFDLEAVMEEIRKNIGEEAFTKMMEDIASNIPTPDSQKNVTADNRRVIPGIMPKFQKFRDKAVDRDEGTLAANRRVGLMTGQKAPELSAARQQAKDNATNATIAKNLPSDDSRSGADITKQIADTSRVASTNPTTARGTGTTAPKASNDVGSPSNLGASGGQTASTEKTAPMPPPRPANLAADRPAPSAANAAKMAAPRPADLQPNRAAANGDAAQRIQQSFIDRDK